MEIYRLYVHFTKASRDMECNCVCLKVDENWSEETYYLGPSGLNTARKDLDKIKKADYYTDHIELDECEAESNGRIRKTRMIDEFWKNSSGRWV